MAEDKRTDLLGKLQELSEEAMHRLQDAPGGDRVVGTMNAMRDRVDELQRRVRGIDELESRLTALEKKVEKLAKDSGSTPARSTKSKS
jgi:polyhydroxyalkanoate synthesis regulator phasin